MKKCTRHSAVRILTGMVGLITFIFGICAMTANAAPPTLAELMSALEIANKDESVKSVLRILDSAEMKGLAPTTRYSLLNSKREPDGWSPLASASVQGC